eukprot:Seg3581.2 transcript_id=Seg3581.2/GoldUCD/mRNA.D3Y31 product="Translation initiation factor IF-3" protein_id=Seg3581.2/GoldUCD/D3Y31
MRAQMQGKMLQSLHSFWPKSCLMQRGKIRTLILCLGPTRQASSITRHGGSVLERGNTYQSKIQLLEPNWLPNILSTNVRSFQIDSMKCQSSDSISRDGQIHLIDENGKSLGMVNFHEAKLQAESRELQLHQIKPVSHQSPHALYKLMSKKSLFEMKRKTKEQQHNLSRNQQKTKELSLSTDIGEQDLAWKLSKIKEFLSQNNKVKLLINQKFRSRNSNKQFLDLILEKLKDSGETEGNIVDMGRRLKCMLKPVAKSK